MVLTVVRGEGVTLTVVGVTLTVVRGDGVNLADFIISAYVPRDLVYQIDHHVQSRKSAVAVCCPPVVHLLWCQRL